MASENLEHDVCTYRNKWSEMTSLACTLDLESRFAWELAGRIRIGSRTFCFKGEWLKPNKAACKFAGNLPIFAVKFAHSVGQFARRDFLADGMYRAIELCYADMRKQDETETGRDRNCTKRDGTADRVRKCGSIAMADDWDHNPFNSRLTKRPLCRLTRANPPEPIAPPDRPRPCRKVEFSDRAVTSIGQNAVRRNRPRAIVPRRYILRRIEYPN